jgi:hypothetical protein
MGDIMLRVLAGIIAGTIGGIVAVGLVERVGDALYPLPQVPMTMLTVELIGWAIGSFVAGALGARIARAGPIPGLVAGAFLLFAGIVSLIEISHPFWMIVAGAAALTLPALIASLLFERRA